MFPSERRYFELSSSDTPDLPKVRITVRLLDRDARILLDGLNPRHRKSMMLDLHRRGASVKRWLDVGLEWILL